MAGGVDTITDDLLRAAQRGEEDVVSAMVLAIGGSTQKSRAAVWALCLGVDVETSTDIDTDGVQMDRESLRMDITLLLEQEAAYASQAGDIEKTLVMLCKENNMRYQPDLLDILSPLLCFFDTLSPAQVCAVVSPFVLRFVPFLLAATPEADIPVANSPAYSPRRKGARPSFSDGPHQSPCMEAFPLLARLLLQYHDAALCMFLDKHKVDAGVLFTQWLRCLFTIVAERSEVLRIWDLLVTSSDATLPLFLALALLRENRELVMESAAPPPGVSSADDSFDAVLERIYGALGAVRLAGKPLDAEGDEAEQKAVILLLGEAKKLRQATPPSAIDDAVYLLSHIAAPRPSADAPSADADEVATALLEKFKRSVVLPVQSEELVEAFKKVDPAPGHLKFMVLDCRSAKSFKFARLPTAVHIGPNVGFDPEKMEAVLARFEGARGSHFCLLGTGRGIMAEDNLLNVIALRFINANFDHIAFAETGFKGVIDYIRADVIEYVREAPSPTNEEAEPEAATGPPAAAADKESKESLASSVRAGLQAKAAAIDTEAMKKQASVKAASMKKWGRGLMDKWGGSGAAAASDDKVEEKAAPAEKAAAPAAAVAAAAPAAAAAPEEKKKAKSSWASFASKASGAVSAAASKAVSDFSGESDAAGKEKPKATSSPKAQAEKKNAAATATAAAAPKGDGKEASGAEKPSVADARKQSVGGASETAFSLGTGDEDSDDDFQLIAHPKSVSPPTAAPAEAQAVADKPAEPQAEEAAAAPAAAEEGPSQPAPVEKQPEPAEAAPATAAPATAAPKAAAAADDEDDLFGGPIVSPKKKEKKPVTLDDDDDLFGGPVKKETDKKAPAKAKKGGDVDIFADDFDINDIELPSSSKSSPKEKKEKKKVTDDFDDLFA